MSCTIRILSLIPILSTFQTVSEPSKSQSPLSVDTATMIFSSSSSDAKQRCSPKLEMEWKFVPDAAYRSYTNSGKRSDMSCFKILSGYSVRSVTFKILWSPLWKFYIPLTTLCGNTRLAITVPQFYNCRSMKRSSFRTTSRPCEQAINVLDTFISHSCNKHRSMTLQIASNISLIKERTTTFPIDTDKLCSFINELNISYCAHQRKRISTWTKN